MYLTENKYNKILSPTTVSILHCMINAVHNNDDNNDKNNNNNNQFPVLILGKFKCDMGVWFIAPTIHLATVIAM